MAEPQPTVNPVDTPQALSPEALAALFLVPQLLRKDMNLSDREMYPGGGPKAGMYDIKDTDSSRKPIGWMDIDHSPERKAIKINGGDFYGQYTDSPKNGLLGMAPRNGSLEAPNSKINTFPPNVVGVGPIREMIRALQRQFPDITNILVEKDVSHRPNLQQPIPPRNEYMTLNVKSQLDANKDAQTERLIKNVLGAPAQPLKLPLPPITRLNQTGGGAMPGTRISDIW